MRKLIFGCGYLGGRVAERWLADGNAVAAVTRNAEQRAGELRRRGIEPVVADVTRPETLCRLPAASTVLYAVGFDRQGEKSRWDVYVDGLRCVLDALPPETGRVIFIGSTGVYGQSNGEWVDEDSPCQPTREAGRALLAAEQVLVGHPLGARAIVLRMAGMYGHGRLPRRAELLRGDPIPARADSWLNLIHVDDAAAVVLAAERSAQPPAVYVVSDGQPADRRTCLCCLAQLLGAPTPRLIDPSDDFLASHHSGSNKRVRNARMLTDLKVQLVYPSYKEGLSTEVIRKSPQ